jgi:hypothetical protein
MRGAGCRAQIKHMALHRSAARYPTVLHDAPIAVVFAVFGASLWRRNMTPAFQSRWPFRKGLGRHRTRFQPARAHLGRTIPDLIGIPRSHDFQNRGQIAKVGLGKTVTTDLL